MTTRVLVVEDSPTQAEVLQAHLEDAGYAVTVAATGEAALAEIERGSVDLVISDIVMPGAVDGYELCRQIKHGPAHDLPVVLLTSLADPLDIIRGLECGADNFFTKPYQPEALLERIELLLRNRRLRLRDRLSTGVRVYFMGREFLITSEREQILDLLVTTFEEAVHQNRQLRQREEELESARAELARYAGSLEAELERFFELSLDLMCIAGFDGYFKRLNPAWESSLGWTREELLAVPYLDFVHPDEHERTREEALRLRRGGRTIQFENRFRTRDGSYRWMEWQAIPLVDAQLIYAVARDVTQAKEAEEALRASEARYRHMFEQHPHPMWVFDRETLRFLAVNEAAIAEYGYSREEFLAMNLDQIRPQEDIGELRRNVAAYVPGREQSRWRHRKKDGTVITVEVSSNDLAVAGRPARVVAITDVTAREQALRALESRARQQAAVASLGELAIGAPDLQMLLDAATRLAAETLEVGFARVLELQAAGRELLLRAGHGWHRDMVGRVRIPATPDTAPGCALAKRQPVVVIDESESARFGGADFLADMGVISGIEVIVPIKSGSFGTLGVGSRRPRAFSPDDVHFLRALAHILAAAIDRERTERALRQTQRLDSVGRLASGVAHDFNNLLTVILGETQLALQEASMDEPLRHGLGEIAKAGERAAGLTRQLLAFARQDVVRPTVIDVNELVRSADHMLLRLIGEDVERALRLAADAGTVKMDRGQLEQVLVNLVVNARDAMPGGGRITIETSTRRGVPSSATVEIPAGSEPDDVEYTVLAIHDTGTGMSDEVKQHIFEPFFTTKETGKGTGLGLATCYGIVQQAGGHIVVDSTPGAGTCFEIYLPRVREPVSQEAPALAAASRGGGETILLVEDEPAVRRLMTRMLDAHGFRVLAAENGDEAMRFLVDPRTSIDLLLTDVTMPGLQGGELARQAREHRAGLPVLYVSGYSADEKLRNLAADGREAHLTKPFTGELLVRSVRELLEAQREER